MGKRVTSVDLRLQYAEFVGGMEKSAQKVRELGTETEKLAAKKEAFQQLGTTALAVGTMAAVGVGLAVAKFSEFDAAMSSVQAATHESTGNMQLMREAAIEAGADTVFTATEAANAVEELAKAGVETADVLGGALAGSLDLASAGELGVAEAAEIAATAMTQFKLAGKDVPHIADLLAAGAGKAQGSVQDLSMALNQGGLVAAQTGLSIEEATGTLSAFASAGLLGSDAGTSFKTMLQRLTPQSAEAREKMEELGISAYDAQGQFVGMEKFAGILQKSLKGLTPEARNAALGVMFGSDAVRAAAVVFEQGAEGIGEWIDKVDDAGYAALTARIKLDNLNGDVEKLGGSFDTALIQSGAAANDVLRSLTRTATEAVDAYNEMPDWAQGVALSIGGVTAAVGLGSAAFLLGVPRIAAYRGALATLGPTAQKTAAAVGLVGKSVGVVMALGFAHEVRGWAQDLTGATTSADGFVKALDNSASASSILDKALGGNELDVFGSRAAKARGNILQLTGGMSGFNSVFADVQNSLVGTIAEVGTFGLIDTTLGTSKKNLAELDQALSVMVNGGNVDKAKEVWEALVKQTDGSKESIKKLKEMFPEYSSASRDAAKNTEVTVEEIAGLDDVANRTTESISALADEIAGFGRAQFNVNATAREFEASIDDAAAALQRQKDAFIEVQEEAYKAANDGSLDGFVGTLDGFIASLDIATESGRENQAALDAIAKSANDAAAAIVLNGGSTDESSAAIERGREALVLQLEQFGVTGEAAQDYIDKLLSTPAEIKTQAVLMGVDLAQEQIDQLVANNSGRVIDIQTRATLPDLNGDASGSGRPGLADGGEIPGSGGPRQDNILIRASVGEHMFDAEDVRRMGGQSAVYKFRQSLYDGAQRYADGGEVRYMRSPQTNTPAVAASTGATYAPTWQISANGTDPLVVAAELDAKQKFRMRSGL
ncbi:TP901 family phage tail tape measure protein [Microterricola gilva]|uniref:TP901 family phage tail tape measure protein n=1 Tax=Microterricola gilva TaxID=393267 RepID=A0A4Q8AKA9_9MICO|nr:phage tail tape measure protein [Microterricola gilva]RZU64940.1 TP901 family phage tail tape measure protein [Microterricola gilva]